ncbi:RNA polymerase II elongation factor [Borealophlyctis nickersoniae]|nr:RNA polymerase II elongation factor [Borealophlyctis nickersoniae]
MSLNEEALVKIKEKLRKSLDEEKHSLTADLLDQLKKLRPTTEILRKTKIGVFVNDIKKNPKASDAEKEIARQLVGKWKNEVASSKSNGKETKASPKVKIEKTIKGEKTTPQPSPSTPQPATPRLVTADSRTVAGDGVDIRGTGDKTRDKCIEMLYGALASGTSIAAEKVLKIAETIEQRTHILHGDSADKSEYKARIRTLFMNLKDKHNPELRENVLKGTIKPEAFAEMSTSEMASQERKAEAEQARKEGLNDAIIPMPEEAETDQFLCSRCHKRKCSYTQMQTRSADEPMTTFVKCLNCGKRWKFC